MVVCWNPLLWGAWCPWKFRSWTHIYGGLMSLGHYMVLACSSLVIMHMKPIRCCKLVVRSLYPYFGVLLLLWWWSYIVERLDMLLMIWRPWIWWWYSWKSLCSHVIGGVGVLDTLDMMSIWWIPPPCWCEVYGCEYHRIPHAFDDVQWILLPWNICIR